MAKILYLLGHNVKNRVLSFIFRRSGESTSCHFYNVLRAIVELEDNFIKQSQVPLEIANISKFYPYFRVIKVNCSLNFIYQCSLFLCYLSYFDVRIVLVKLMAHIFVLEFLKIMLQAFARGKHFLDKMC